MHDCQNTTAENSRTCVENSLVYYQKECCLWSKITGNSSSLYHTVRVSDRPTYIYVLRRIWGQNPFGLSLFMTTEDTTSNRLAVL